MTISSYRDLRVWQMSMDLVQAVYAVTRRFPTFERYALASQLQRSAVSIPSNIAEGHARSSTRDYLRYVAMARGSLAETQTQLMIASRLGYGSASEVSLLLEHCELIARMLRRLQQALTARVRQGDPSIPYPLSSTRPSNA